MNALIFTPNGVRQGTIGAVTRNFNDNQITLNVETDHDVTQFSPSDFVTADMLTVDTHYPFVLVQSKRDYRAIAKLTPKTRKPRTKKSK